MMAEQEDRRRLTTMERYTAALWCAPVGEQHDAACKALLEYLQEVGWPEAASVDLLFRWQQAPWSLLWAELRRAQRTADNEKRGVSDARFRRYLELQEEYYKARAATNNKGTTKKWDPLAPWSTPAYSDKVRCALLAYSVAVDWEYRASPAQKKAVKMAARKLRERYPEPPAES